MLNTTHICKHFNIPLGTRPFLMPLLSKFTILSYFPIRNVWCSHRVFNAAITTRALHVTLVIPTAHPVHKYLIYDCIFLPISSFKSACHCPEIIHHPLQHYRHYPIPHISKLPMNYLYIILGTCFQLLTLHHVDSNKSSNFDHATIFKTTLIFISNLPQS